MHLLARDLHTIDAPDEAADLCQPPGDLVFLSFSDSDLGLLAVVHEQRDARLSLRLANLGQLKHPYSVDLYLEKTVSGARYVVVRCLGGADYWRYGVDELAAFCRAKNIPLALVPGDQRGDARLTQASTVSADDLALSRAYFDEGGADNAESFLRFVETRLGLAPAFPPPLAIAAAGRCATACFEASAGAPHALIVVYRSLYLAADLAPVAALASRLHDEGFSVETLFVTSLKDPRAADCVAAAIAAKRPDVVLNTTVFSARSDGGGSVLDSADAAVLQVPLATVSREAWAAAPRGLGAIDLAMNVVLPEVDGRLHAPAISFKAAKARDEASGFARAAHEPDRDGIAAAAALAANWARLRRTAPSRRRVAIVLSDYPLKGGREGYAVGLDALASVDAIVTAMRAAGYDIAETPRGLALVEALTRRAVRFSLQDYLRLADALPPAFMASVNACWGAPEADAACENGAFGFAAIEAGQAMIALQPDRGARESRRDTYHDMALPPRHSYVAFYLWMRRVWRADAMAHLGTHGTLEWLPGKSVALSRECAPAVLAGGLPVIYPFIVNDPGEAAQARRRIAAVTIGHMTPPLRATELDGRARDIERLLDEYSESAGLDPRRASRIADAILERAAAAGLSDESGIGADTPRDEALKRLDAWLCDIKDLRLGDGLHIFGHDAPGEITGLLAALDGRFVQPGPAGAPSRARADVLPTGRNLFSADPRSIPTRTAAITGAKIADDVVARYLQDHGDYPRGLMIDLWGSSTMRTGGEDFAQALALLGVKPVWDSESTRVSGFEVVPEAMLARPRIDVTLRISGLFRDVFPAQIAMFDQAVRAVAARGEDDETNPIAAARRASASGEAGARVFGAAPASYGIGIANEIVSNRDVSRPSVGAIWMEASAHAFRANGDWASREDFAARVHASDALIHTQDMAETDILAGTATAEHEGGFIAARASLGFGARVYHVDATREDDVRVRAAEEEIARVARGKFGGARWIAGLMRHGHRGAAEIAETIATLAAFAVSGAKVTDATIDLAFDATLGNDQVCAFLETANPAAVAAIADDFAMLRNRGLWACRRNSSASLLDARAGKAA